VGAACLTCLAAAAPASGDDSAHNAVAATHAKQEPAATVAAEKVTGTVLETLDAAGYTYLRLRTPGGEAWAAVRQTKVSVGATVTVLVQLRMESFESKSLKRTFDQLIMGSLEGAEAAQAAAPAAAAGASGETGGLISSHGSAASAAQPVGMPPGHPPIGSSGAAAAPVKVPKADGANARTVAEIWQEKTMLKDRPVVVRGKVVKFLSGIMGKNWLHLRDGSGSSATRDDDITVTTTGGAAVGDVVVVTGTVRVGKDFGAGYSYPVMIEDATVSK
jgi:hypothetical protein